VRHFLLNFGVFLKCSILAVFHLLHEIIETIKSLNNLDMDHKNLSVLSESLFQVIRDNKLDFRE